MRQIKPCVCGNWSGWFEKRVTQRLQFFDENGGAWASEGLNERGGKRKYCPDCKRDITHLVSNACPNRTLEDAPRRGFQRYGSGRCSLISVPSSRETLSAVC